MQTSLPSRRRASLLLGGAALLVPLLSACDTERPTSPVTPSTPSTALTTALRGPSLNWKMIDEDSALIAVAGSQFSVKGPNNFFKFVFDNGAGDFNPNVGELRLAQVAAGTWTVCEMLVQGPYVQGTLPCRQTVVAGGAGASLAPFFNPHPAYVSFGLTDEVGNYLGGSAFSVADSLGIPDAFNENSPLHDENPLPGRVLKRLVTEDLYTLCEHMPPSGFVVPAAQGCVKFQTNYGDTTVFGNFVNVRPYSAYWGVTDGNLDANNGYVPLGGAKFKVVFPRLLGSIDVDDNGPNDYDLRPGRLAVALPTAGTYSVCETQAPANHWLPNPPCASVNVTYAVPGWAGWFLNPEAQVPNNRTR